MNMFVIIISQKRADPPEHEHSAMPVGSQLCNIYVEVYSKEASEDVCDGGEGEVRWPGERHNWDTDVAGMGSQPRKRTVFSQPSLALTGVQLWTNSEIILFSFSVHWLGRLTTYSHSDTILPLSAVSCLGLKYFLV